MHLFIERTKTSNSRSLVRRGFLLIVLGLACFAVSPAAQAACQEGCDLNKANTFLGDFALAGNTSGTQNTAMGGGALRNNSTGFSNTALGSSALALNSIGQVNTASGAGTLFFNTSGSNDTASGGAALFNNTGGDNNTASGSSALFNNNTGSSNTAVGSNALLNNTSGNNNIAVGESSGTALTTGSNNIDIGNAGIAGESDKIRIGTKGTHTATFIAGINGATVAGGVGVVVGINGKLGTIVSSARFKDDIKPMDKASEAILALRPVSFHYKKELDPEGIPQFGLVAEEVEKVNPDLVVRDEEGRPYAVRYEAVNAMLLNEFLKEHSKVETLEAEMTDQQKQIKALTSALQEQALQIEKVNARVAAGQSAPRVVVNH